MHATHPSWFWVRCQMSVFKKIDVLRLLHWKSYHGVTFVQCSITLFRLYHKITWLYGMKGEASVSLTFDSHCKSIGTFCPLFRIVVLFEDIAYFLAIIIIIASNLFVLATSSNDRRHFYKLFFIVPFLGHTMLQYRCKRIISM